jgi:hypothetical protein
MPAYASKINGAVSAAVDTNQFLVSHAAQICYEGVSLATTNPAYDPSIGAPLAIAGSGASASLPINSYGNGPLGQLFTFAQVCTFPTGASISRLMVPLLNNTLEQGGGLAADVLIEIYATSSAGAPTGSALASTMIPREHIAALAPMEGGLAGNPTATPYTVQVLTNNPGTDLSASPTTLASARFGSMAGQSPDAWVTGGGTLDGANINALCVYALWNGTGLDPWLPGPPLPAPTQYGTICAEPLSDTFFLIGGAQNTTVTGAASAGPCAFVYLATVSGGLLSAWQESVGLPVNLWQHAACGYNGYIYVVGGVTDGAATVTNPSVFWAQVQNGQIASWNTGIPFGGAGGAGGGGEAPVRARLVAVNGHLILTGGVDVSNNPSGTYISKIQGDGSPGPWKPLFSGTSYLGTGVASETTGPAVAVAGDTLISVCGWNAGLAPTTYAAGLTVGTDGDVGMGGFLIPQWTSFAGSESFAACFVSNFFGPDLAGVATTYSFFRLNNAQSPAASMGVQIQPMVPVPFPFQTTGTTPSYAIAFTPQPTAYPGGSGGQGFIAYAINGGNGISLYARLGLGSWINTPGVPRTWPVIPYGVLSGGIATVGRPLHFIEDGAIPNNTYTTVLYSSQGPVKRIASYYNNIRDFRSLAYSNGLLQSVT